MHFGSNKTEYTATHSPALVRIMVGPGTAKLAKFFRKRVSLAGCFLFPSASRSSCARISGSSFLIRPLLPREGGNGIGIRED